MIYICEYGSPDRYRVLQERTTALLPQFKEDIYAEKPKQEPADADARKKARRPSADHVLAWGLLAYGIRLEYGLSLDELAVRRGEWGKPDSSAYPGLQFSLSHCRTACACMIAPVVCGIDVERKFSYREPLAKKICHADEWRILQSLPEQERERQLRLLWSLKEAFVKRDGRGLGYGVDRANFAGYLPLMSGGAAEGIKSGAVLFQMTNAEIQAPLDFLLRETETYTLAACVGQIRVANGTEQAGQTEATDRTEQARQARTADETEQTRQAGAVDGFLTEIRYVNPEELLK